MDSLALQLTEGPQGYKITLKNMEAFGASNFQVKSLKLGVNGGEPFKARIVMPKLKIEAKYTSSGVLLIIPASGGGEFHAIFDGVTADLTGKTSARGKYLHMDSLSIALDVKKANMSISGAFNNNRILRKLSIIMSIGYNTQHSSSIHLLFFQWKPQISSCATTHKLSWRRCKRSSRRSWPMNSANWPISCSNTFLSNNSTRISLLLNRKPSPKLFLFNCNVLVIAMNKVLNNLLTYCVV